MCTREGLLEVVLGF
jgi:hypothetical protein